MRLIYI